MLSAVAHCVLDKAACYYSQLETAFLGGHVLLLKQE